MSSYLEMTQPSQQELNRRVVNSLSRQLMKNNVYASRASNITKGSGSNKNKKNALVRLFTQKQTGRGLTRSHQRRNHRSRKHRKEYS